MQNPEIMFTNHELKIHSNTSHEAVLLQTNPWDELLSEPFSRQDIRSLSPATNIYEYENQFIIIMAIPGLEKKDFVIHVKKKPNYRTGTKRCTTCAKKVTTLVAGI